MTALERLAAIRAMLGQLPGSTGLTAAISQATTCAPKNLFCSTRIAGAYAVGKPGLLGQIKQRDYTESPSRSYFTF
jgi:hypothetical protein